MKKILIALQIIAFYSIVAQAQIFLVYPPENTKQEIAWTVGSLALVVLGLHVSAEAKQSDTFTVWSGIGISCLGATGLYFEIYKW